MGHVTKSEVEMSSAFGKGFTLGLGRNWVTGLATARQLAHFVHAFGLDRSQVILNSKIGLGRGLLTLLMSISTKIYSSNPFYP